jgi:hypothetical protein
MEVRRIEISQNYKKPRPVIAIGEAEFKRIVRKDSPEVLRQKLQLGDVILGFIALNPDPRGIEAIKRIQREMGWLREIIAEKEQEARRSEVKILLPGEADPDKPPPQVITLKTLKLFSDLNK